jgi:hypothetical protein
LADDAFSKKLENHAHIVALDGSAALPRFRGRSEMSHEEYEKRIKRRADLAERGLLMTERRSRAQKRGQHMGQPPKLTPAQKAEARRRRAQGATHAELARGYHVGKSTISRLIA